MPEEKVQENEAQETPCDDIQKEEEKNSEAAMEAFMLMEELAKRNDELEDRITSLMKQTNWISEVILALIMREEGGNINVTFEEMEDQAEFGGNLKIKRNSDSFDISFEAAEDSPPYESDAPESIPIGKRTQAMDERTKNMIASVLQESAIKDQQNKMMQAVIGLMLKRNGGSFTIANTDLDNAVLEPIVMEGGKISTVVRFGHPEPRIIT